MILRTRSKRCRQKIDQELGYHPQYYWTWAAGAVFLKVTDDEYRKVSHIKGLTKARVDEADLWKCWTGGLSRTPKRGAFL